MEKLSYKKLFIQALKDGAEEHKKGEKKPYELLGKEIFNGTMEWKYKKVVAATELLLEIAPEIISGKIKDVLNDKDYDKLPFDLSQYEFQERIGKGEVSKVHLLQAKDMSEPSYVLKICYRQKGDVDSLQKVAQTEHEEYERISAIYKDIKNFIPAEQSIITTDKKNGEPVIATIQQYMGQDMRDFFSEIETGELKKMFEENEDFRKEFIQFADITLQLFRDKGEVIDLSGRKNLSVIEKEGRPHLRFIDPHNISSTASSDNKKMMDRIQNALVYIKEIRDSVGD